MSNADERRHPTFPNQLGNWLADEAAFAVSGGRPPAALHHARVLAGRRS